MDLNDLYMLLDKRKLTLIVMYIVVIEFRTWVLPRLDEFTMFFNFVKLIINSRLQKRWSLIIKMLREGVMLKS